MHDNGSRRGGKKMRLRAMSAAVLLTAAGGGASGVGETGLITVCRPQRSFELGVIHNNDKVNIKELVSKRRDWAQ